MLAGNYDVSFEEAEEIKKDPARQSEILPVVRPVVEKMAAIVKKHIQGRDVTALYLVGGTCCLKNMEDICTRSNPRMPSHDDIVTLLEQAW